METRIERIEYVMKKDRDNIRESFFDYQHAFFKETSKWYREYCLDMMRYYDAQYREVLNLLFKCGFIKLSDYMAGYDVLDYERQRCTDIFYNRVKTN